jgi:hypothetical protein
LSVMAAMRLLNWTLGPTGRQTCSWPSYARDGIGSVMLAWQLYSS